MDVTINGGEFVPALSGLADGSLKSYSDGFVGDCATLPTITNSNCNGHKLEFMRTKRGKQAYGPNALLIKPYMQKLLPCSGV